MFSYVVGKKSRFYVNEPVAAKGHKWYKEVQRRCKWEVGKSGFYINEVVVS